MHSDYPAVPLGSDRFPVPQLCVDLVLLTIHEGQVKVLMRQWRDEPFAGQLILPGGFLRERVTLEDHARALAAQFVDLHDWLVRPFGMFSDPGRDPRGWVISAGFIGLVPWDVMESAVALRPNLVLVEVRYVQCVGLSTLTIGDHRVWAGFDHEDIVVAALCHLRGDLDVSTHGFDLLPREFSLLELQKVHEAILGTPLNQATFRKRMLARTFVCGSYLQGTDGVAASQGRPARLYHLFR